MSDVIAHVDLSAIAFNLQQVKRRAPSQRILAMVKSNGYGHGLVPVAQALRAADGFGVADLDEALSLRAHGVTQPIVLMSGCWTKEVLLQCCALRITPVVHHKAHLDMLRQTKLPDDFKLWLQVDTGMCRLGFLPGELPMISSALRQMVPEKNWVVMSHFSEADHENRTRTEQQLSCYQAATSTLVCPVSVANSAAILRPVSMMGDWLRPGVMLYGISPFAQTTAADFGLQAAMTLTATVVSTGVCHKGQCVGYASTWRAAADTPVAVVAIGYGHGYPRQLSAAARVLIGADLCPVIGRVSMDLLVVDTSCAAAVQMGQKVTLWGANLPVEQLAQAAQSIAYTHVAALTCRVKRQYRHKIT